jgi:hypothetical protein
VRGDSLDVGRFAGAIDAFEADELAGHGVASFR